MKTWQPLRLFLSYTLRDSVLCRDSLVKLSAALSRIGYVYVDLLDNVDPSPQTFVMRKLEVVDALVGCMTPGWTASPWVRLELSVARRRGIPIVAIDPCRFLLRPLDGDQLDASCGVTGPEQLRYSEGQGDSIPRHDLRWLGQPQPGAAATWPGLRVTPPESGRMPVPTQEQSGVVTCS